MIALFGAFVFAELSTVMPRVGGQYAFFREAFSPIVAFLYGWGLLLIVQSGATAAVAVAFAEYVARLVDLPAGSTSWLAAAILLALAGFHALGIKPGAVVINLITFSKTLALAALIVGAFVLDPRLRASPSSPSCRRTSAGSPSSRPSSPGWCRPCSPMAAGRTSTTSPRRCASLSATCRGPS